MNACTIWYMHCEDSVEIDAPAQLVWEVFSDVESWPEWTASVTSLVARDGAGLAIGKRFATSTRHVEARLEGQRNRPRIVLDVGATIAGCAK